MYFAADGQYYVPYLSADGKELYVMVDRPPQPPPQGTAPAAAPTTAPAAVPAASGPSAAEEAPAVRAVKETFTVASGTLLVVRLAKDLSSETARPATASRASDQDLAADGRLVAPAGAKVVRASSSAADSASKMKGTASLSVTLTDMQVGGQVLSIKTQPLSVKGGSGSGAKKLVGGAAVGAAIGAIAGGGEGAAWGAAIGAGAGGVAAAAGDVKAAVIPAQSPQAFTLAVPFQVELMTNVAVR